MFSTPETSVRVLDKNREISQCGTKSSDVNPCPCESSLCPCPGPCIGLVLVLVLSGPVLDKSYSLI